MSSRDFLSRSQFWHNSTLPCVLEYRQSQIPYPPHTHDFYELVIVMNGTGLHVSQDASINLEKGNIFIVCPGQEHSYKFTQNLELMNILVSPDFIDNFPQIKGFKSFVNQNYIDYFKAEDIILLEIQSKLEKIQSELKREQPGYDAMITAYLTELFIYVIRSFDKDDSRKSGVKYPVYNIKHYIETHYLEKININTLVSLSGLSESSMLRRFKQNTGYTPIEYQLHLKLLEASRELIETDDSITDIAWNTGFNDSNYFCRYFKKMFTISPREYRRQYRPNLQNINKDFTDIHD